METRANFGYMLVGLILLWLLIPILALVSSDISRIALSDSVIRISSPDSHEDLSSWSLIKVATIWNATDYKAEH